MKPAQLKVIDEQRIRDVVQNYIDYIDSDDVNEDRISKNEYPIIEETLQAVYGDDLFKWINAELDRKIG